MDDVNIYVEEIVLSVGEETGSPGRGPDQLQPDQLQAVSRCFEETDLSAVTAAAVRASVSEAVGNAVQRMS